MHPSVKERDADLELRRKSSLRRDREDVMGGSSYRPLSEMPSLKLERG